MKKIVMIESQEFFSDVKIGAHHYAERFAENGYEVLWISPAFTPIHKFNKAIKIDERKKLSKGKRVELKKNIYGYSPKVYLPFVNVKLLNSKLVGKVYLYTAMPSIRRILKRLGFLDIDILWISNIKMYYIKNIIRYNKLIHRIADDKKGFSNFFETLENFEKDIIRNADLVYATSTKLVEKFSPIRENIKYLPNGVNYQDFIPMDYSYPKDIQDLKDKKICIYIGAIAEWLDFEKIIYSIENLEEVNFLFIGPKHVDFSKIESYTNVRYLGKKQYNDLINYLKVSNVAWIPFIKNDLTDAINPVKLYEYLAAGIPTVTTRLREIEDIDGPFRISGTKEELVQDIKDCINSYYKKEDLIQYSKRNTWDQKFIQIINDINKLTT